MFLLLKEISFFFLSCFQEETHCRADIVRHGSLSQKDQQLLEKLEEEI